MAAKFSKKQKNSIFRRDQYRCAYCGVKLVRYADYEEANPDNAATVDHVKPKSMGGKANRKNGVSCCERCNKVLGNKVISFEEKKAYIAKLHDLGSDLPFGELAKEVQRWDKRTSRSACRRYH